MPKSMNIEIEGNQVRLQREQWSGNVAYISNYPGLLEEVKKYTWTYTSWTPVLELFKAEYIIA